MTTIRILLAFTLLASTASAQLLTNQELVQIKTAGGVLTSYGYIPGANKIVITDNTGRRTTSSTLPGTPLAPTASLGTNTTQIATTAFVLANGSRYLGSAANRAALTSLSGKIGDHAKDNAGNVYLLVSNTGFDPGDWMQITDADLLGSSASLDAGTAAGNLVQLDGGGFLPALNGSALTSLNASAITSGSLADARIASAATWNAKENALTFGSGLTRSSNTITIGSGGITNTMLAGSIDLATKATSNPYARTNHTGTQAASTITGLPDVWIIAISDETTAITTGTAKVTFRAPYAATVTGVRFSVNTVSSSGNPAVDINESGVSILGTTLSIDASEKTSVTAATAATITDTSLADDAEMTIDIDTAGTGAKGAKVAIYVTR